MPASERSLRVTDAYRARLLTLRARLVAVTDRAWQQLTLDDLEGSYRAWTLTTLAALTAAQRSAIRLSDSYLASFIAHELGRPEPVSETGALEQMPGRGDDGRALTEVLAPPLYTVRWALGDGRGAQRALQMGRARAARTVAWEIHATARTALDRGLIADRRVVGWRRATSGNACGACLAAATGAIHPSAAVLRVHGFCKCTKEPVVRGARERAHRPTGQEIFDAKSRAEQDAMFRGRGGAEKAELIRSGQVPLEQLAQRSPMATRPDLITEAPMSALRP